MSFTSKTAATAIALTLMLGGASAAFAKAHDQGVADGEFPAISTGELVQGNGVPGISAGVNKGARGDLASGNDNNRVVPVVGNGKNASTDANSVKEPD